VAEEGSSITEMKDLTSTSFGYLIAFLLPGMFGLYALSYWFPTVGALLQPVLKADASVGPSVVLLLIAVGMGLIITAVRYYLFEKLLCRKHKLPTGMFARLVDEGRLSSFKAVADEHYRYHQFYGGCAVALLMLFSGWLTGQSELSCHLTLVSMGFVVLELLFISASRQTYIQFVKRGTIVVNGPPIQSIEDKPK
jgi:hypothetical protein